MGDTKTFEGIAFLSRSYGDIGYYHYSAKNTDSSFYYYKKQEEELKLLPKDKPEYIVHYMSALYHIKGCLFLEQKKQNDSALFYFQKGYDLKKKIGNNDLVAEYGAFGNYYTIEKNYQKALEYYLKVEKNAKEQPSQFNDNNDNNRSLVETYEALQQPKMQSFYLKKYTKFNDSLRKVQKTNVDLAVTNLVKKQIDETSTVKNNYTVILSVITIVLLIVSLYIYKYFKKKNTDVDKAEMLLIEKEEENKDLKQKVNESFEEVVQLAKENNPEFLTRFQEIYPNFSSKLKEIYPDISSEDVRFCALLKLNFSTKDISDYTFVTVRTVQTRKSRLRKKFNIPSDVDIYLWMNECNKFKEKSAKSYK